MRSNESYQIMYGFYELLRHGLTKRMFHHLLDDSVNAAIRIHLSSLLGGQ